MRTALRQFNRLRGKSVHELGVRGRQELAALRERTIGSGVGEITDRAFLRHIKHEARGRSAGETASLIANRIHSQAFIPSLGSRHEIARIMEQRFGHAREAIISRATRAMEGRFDVLGFRDLSFGNPPDWLLEPISGKRAPLDHWSQIKYLDPAVVGDKKITWELNRHQHFVAFGQAHWMTNDDIYAQAFVTQATSWMDANPAARGINWVSSLELALRSISWLWALNLLAGSPCLTEEFELRLLKHLVVHGLHIQSHLSHYFSPNTHLTGEALGLFYLGTALPELRRAEAWRELGLKILVDESSKQIQSDGVYFEQSTYYHRYTADFYTHLLVLARAAKNDLPTAVDRKLEQLMTHLMFIMRPDGSYPLIGDDDGGRLIVLGSREPDDFGDTLATAAALYGRADWKRAAGEGAPETLWLLGPEGLARFDGLQSDEPNASSYVFQASGYSVLRDGWAKDSTYALMDYGPHGSLACGHAHADALSIEFAALGKTWIVDPGTFTYTANPELRDWFRSTGAHNTVTVDGESQSIPAGPFSWKRVARTVFEGFIIGENFDYLEGSHDGYERLADPVKHTRSAIFSKPIAETKRSASLPSYLIVRDSFTASNRHSYALSYHLAPGCSVLASGNTVIVTEPGGSRLHLVAFGHSTLRARIVEGWVSRAYGQRESAPVAVFDAEADGAQDFTTFIVPTKADQSVRVEELQVDSVSTRGFKVVSGALCDVLLTSDGTQLVSSANLAATARIAWARFVNDAFARAFIIRGQRLETADGFAFRSAAEVKHCEIYRTDVRLECSIDGESFVGAGFGQPTRIALANGNSFELGQRVEGMGRASSQSCVGSAREAIN